MQSALISTLAPTYNSIGLESGYSIIEFVPLGDDFPVNSDFFWAAAPDLATSQTYYYETSSSTVVVIPRYYSTVPLEVNPVGTELVTSQGVVLLNITTLTPPAPVAQGQTLYFYDGAWVVSSFDPSLTLPQAKYTLISLVNQGGAAAVNTELGLYSNIQQIEAPSVLALDSLTYPNITIGEYQTYIDGQVVTSTATINAATSTEDLYTFNPVEVPYILNTSGTLFTGRGAGLGPLDLNVSYYTAFNSVSMTEADTELYVPGTSTVIPYGSYPGGFDSAGNCFNPGDFLIQIRETDTGIVIAQFQCPLSPGQNVPFDSSSPPTTLSVTSGSITGTAQVGSTLTYTPGVTSGGTAPITTSWIWKRGLITVGTTSSTTYVPVVGDEGSVITVVITATDYTLNTASATTIPTAAVTPPTPPPANTFNVTNNGSGNYVINGASNPTLTLDGAVTYTFNINAPGHPFWIKTTQTTGTGDQYNTGVTNNGTDNGVITFLVTFAPEPFTLYYNCQYHASMAGVLNIEP